MNIAQVEKLTGITKQNIRFYEKEGLIEPKRNKTNGYREYEEEDINNLKFIRVLRKTGMPLEEIKQVLNGTKSLENAMLERKRQVEKERAELANVLKLCDELRKESSHCVDADYYLSWIEGEEKKGHAFYQLWEDYKEVARSEAKKKFIFVPENIITTPAEFTREILSYAESQKAEIYIIKESFYPEFLWNGVEYSAMRINGRYGPVVHCEMIHPEEAEPVGMEEKRKEKLRFLVKLIPAILLGMIVLIYYFAFEQQHLRSMGEMILILSLIVVFLVLLAGYIKYHK